MAGLTLVVICGLILTEVLAVYSGELEVWRMAPTWALQVILLGLFAGGYYYRFLEQWVGGPTRG